MVCVEEGKFVISCVNQYSLSSCLSACHVRMYPMRLAAGPPDPSHACTSIRVHGQGGAPYWVPPRPPRQLTERVIIFAGALVESGSIATMKGKQ